MTAAHIQSYRRHGIYYLKNWQVNVKDLKLTCNTPVPREVTLATQQMALLCYLSDHHRSPIEDDQLQQHLCNLGLSQQKLALPQIDLLIAQLCDAFGQGQQIIQRINLHSYILTADPQPSEGVITQTQQETVYHLGEFGRKKRFGFAAVIALSAFLLFAIIYRPTPPPLSQKAATITQRQQALVVVLPFENSANDTDFSEGLATLVTQHLAQSKTLAVIARDSAFSYQNRYQNAIQIGTLLGASHIIKGKFSSDGHSLKLQLELLVASADKVLWRKDYQGTMTQLAKLCRELFNDIARALDTQFGIDDIALWQSPLTSKQLQQVVIASAWLEQHQQENINSAVEQLFAVQQNVVDSRLVTPLLAKGLLSQYHNEQISKEALLTQLSNLTKWLKTEPAKSLALELTALQKAIEGQAKQAQNLYLQLIDMQPNNSNALLRLGALYQRNDEFNQARAILDKAYRLNPNHHAVNHYLGRNLLLQGELTQAMEHMTKAIDARHSYPGVEIEIAHWYRAYGDLTKAAQWAAVAKAKSPDKEAILAQAVGQADKTALSKTLEALKSAPGTLEDELFELASLHFYNGDLAALKQLLDSQQDEHSASFALWSGYWHLAQGQFKQALNSLEPLINQALPQHWPLAYRFAILNRLTYAATQLHDSKTSQRFLLAAEQEQNKLLACGLKTPLFVSEMAANLLLKGHKNKARQILKNVAAKRWQLQQYLEHNPTFILLQG